MPPGGALAALPFSSGQIGEGTMSDNRESIGTYLTEAEAKEFHKIFMSSFLGFTAVAVVAHVLVWFWRPWL
jgi:light-harvesting complex 1 beta chain